MEAVVTTRTNRSLMKKIKATPTHQYLYISKVPLQLKVSRNRRNENIFVWKNPKTLSPRYFIPIKL